MYSHLFNLYEFFFKIFQGDIGGPITYAGKVVGIASRYIKDCQPGFPVLFGDATGSDHYTITDKIDAFNRS